MIRIRPRYRMIWKGHVTILYVWRGKSRIDEYGILTTGEGAKKVMKQSITDADVPSEAEVVKQSIAENFLKEWRMAK